MSNKYTIESVSAALGVLEYVSDHPDTTVSEVSAALEMNVSKSFRMLNTLVQSGFISCDNKNRYRLGLKSLFIGIQANKQVDVSIISEKILEKLRDEIGETVQIRLRDGNYSICIARTETHHAVRVYGSVGSRRLLNVGASGKVLLAGCNKDQQMYILESLAKLSQEGLDKVLDELKLINEVGYAISYGEFTPGVVALSVPIFKRNNDIFAALGVSFVESRFIKDKKDDYVNILKKAAGEISAAMSITA